MDVWTDRWMDGKMDGWMEGGMGRRKNGQAEQVSRQVDGEWLVMWVGMQVCGWLYRSIDGLVEKANKQVDRRTGTWILP